MKIIRPGLLFIVLSLFSLYIHAQDLRYLNKKSYYKYIYQLPADSVQKMNTDNSAFEPTLSNFKFIDSFPALTEYTKVLPVGHYFEVYVADRKVHLDYKLVTNILAKILGDYKRNKLVLHSRSGNDITDATVTFRKRKFHYDRPARAYLIPFSREDGRMLTIEAGGEKIFYDYTTDDKEKPDRDDRKKAREKRTQKHKEERSNGYIVFNKPKYLPGDTVRLKAYILHKNNKPYTVPLRVRLSVSTYGTHDYYTLADDVRPVSPGAYVYEFVIGDSLQLDRRYNISFADMQTGRNLQEDNFYLEDYLLDKYTYSFTVDREFKTIPVSDTIRMAVSGKDQNGMNVMDSRVRITAVSSDVEQWYTDQECVPDTLFIIEKKLSAIGETKLTYPIEWLPNVKMPIDLSADFINSAGEHQFRSERITIDRNSRRLEVRREKDSIYADIVQGGRSIAGSGWLEVEGDDDDPLIDTAITFPYRIRIDPFADSYDFIAYGPDTLTNSFDNSREAIYLSALRTDSSIIIYPHRQHTPFYYTIYHGRSIIAKGQVTDHIVAIPDHTNNVYEALIQYISDGEVQYRTSTIGLQRYKLRVKLQQKDIVYPGQKDSVAITVSDHKDRPVSDVNLTALSFNDQFHSGLNIKGLTRFEHRSSYEDAEVRESELERMEEASTSLDLGSNPYWIKRTHVDTMLYYQLVYPRQGMLMRSTPVAGLAAQFAPFIFDHGRSVRIHLVYVDGKLAYYSGTGFYMQYSIPVKEGYHNITIRTSNRSIRLDTLHFRDGEKTELIMEWDSVIAKSDTITAELTDQEKRLLQANFIYYNPQRSNDTCFFWQNGSRQVFAIPPIYTSTTPLRIPIGPLTYETTVFYKQHDFNVSFEPERYYAYSFSPAISRLERTDLFADRHIPLTEYSDRYPPLRLGEILYPHPSTVTPSIPYVTHKELFHASDMGYSYGHSGSATVGYLDIAIHADSSIGYIRIYRTDAMGYDRIFRHSTYTHGRSEAMTPGIYNIELITSSGYYAIQQGVTVDSGSICHIAIRPTHFDSPLSVDKLIRDYRLSSRAISDSSLLYIPSPATTTIMGRVSDATGDGIAPATVIIFDTAGRPVGRNTITDRDGYYSFPSLKPGHYSLQFQYTDFHDRIVKGLVVKKDKTIFLGVRLTRDKSKAREITITAYKTPLIDRAETKIESSIVSYDMVVTRYNVALDSVVSRVPGVQIDGGREDEVQYVVNGHRVIGNVNVPMSASKEMLSVEVVSGEKQKVYAPSFGVSAKYGDPNTAELSLEDKYKDASKLRTNFRDYAYWEPNLITDDNGQAKFAVKYPDNTTSWGSYAIAMNTKHQMGVGFHLTRSFKDCSAELATPLFLVAGDTSSAAIKISDYVARPIQLKANFIWDGKQNQENDVTVNDILTDEVPITISADEKRKEIKGSFNISTKAGFGDGEEKSIVVLPRGTEETRGTFALLHGDTSLTIPLDTSLGAVTVRAQSDILDVLIDEVDQIRRYPYWCMEQTASRLVMLSMLEKINTSLGKPFKFQKERKACITKLEKGQLPSGAYGWWEYSPASVRLTTYVLSALAKANAQVKSSYNLGTKDGYRYLDDALPLMTRDEKLNTLELFADRSAYRDLFRSKADPDLSANVMIHLPKIPFDSLSLHQRMQYYKIELMMQRADTFHHWDSILAKKQRTIFGGAYWGEDNWYWYSNQVSTTVLAYEIAELKKDTKLQEDIIQYFLEKRNHNGWRNTSESAKIVSAILPKILADRKGDLSAPTVTIDGIGPVNSFPFTHTFTPTATSLSVNKRGGAPVYFTAYQKVFNPSPKAVSKDFDIATTFKRSNAPVAALNSGESSEIVVDITTKKYCEYLMIEVPIPAGCTYGPKPQGYGYSEVHREYFKDKVVIFCEAFQPGHQEFHIPIESRYKGSYTVNPAKVQSMYFPTFFGRNNIKRISIK
jgi:hypothetical protein